MNGAAIVEFQDRVEFSIAWPGGICCVQGLERLAERHLKRD
jgi:hypothetical protein